MNRNARSLIVVAIAVLVGAHFGRAADVYGLNTGNPDVQSADVLAFGPDGILFIGDTKSAAIFAVQTGDRSGDPSAAAVNVEGLNVKVAEKLGADSQTLRINDLAVNPASGNVYLALASGETPAIVRVDARGAISQLSLNGVPFSRAALPSPPADAEQGQGQRRRNPRADAITDLAFVDGQVIVSGLSAGDAPSSVRSFVFPFLHVSEGARLEIYHGAHGRLEDSAAIRTFVPFTIDGEPSLLAGFVCTPLVRFSLSQLAPGEKVRGTTVAELGNRNRPLDMVVYDKDGRTWLLLINSDRGAMKISTENIQDNPGINEKIEGTAGQAYETIASLAGAVQLDKLNDTQAVALVQHEGGAADLRTFDLP